MGKNHSWIPHCFETFIRNNQNNTTIHSEGTECEIKSKKVGLKELQLNRYRTFGSLQILSFEMEENFYSNLNGMEWNLNGVEWGSTFSIYRKCINSNISD